MSFYSGWKCYEGLYGLQISLLVLRFFRTGGRFQVLFSLATFPNYSLIKYVKIPVFHFFEKVNKRQLKMVYVNH